jgi:hypothetical protein
LTSLPIITASAFAAKSSRRWACTTTPFIELTTLPGKVMNAFQHFGRSRFEFKCGYERLDFIEPVKSCHRDPHRRSPLMARVLTKLRDEQQHDAADDAGNAGN